MPQVLCLKAETYPHKVKTSPQAETLQDGGSRFAGFTPKVKTCATTFRHSHRQSTGMTDLILIFAFILGVQYSNPFWVHGHVPP